jgi:hypothetical protein
MLCSWGAGGGLTRQLADEASAAAAELDGAMRAAQQWLDCGGAAGWGGGGCQCVGLAEGSHDEVLTWHVLGLTPATLYIHCGPPLLCRF